MEYLIFGIVVLALLIVFVGTQLMAILFLMSENEKIQKEAEKNFPPFWLDKSPEMGSTYFLHIVKFN